MKQGNDTAKMAKLMDRNPINFLSFSQSLLIILVHSNEHVIHQTLSAEMFQSFLMEM